MKKVYYTNGLNEKRFNCDEPIPEGWYKGRLKSTITTRDMIWINDGNKAMFISKDDVIPDGWRKGRLKSHLNSLKQKQTMLEKNYHHYTDGIKDFVFSEDDEIPEGLVKGRPKLSDSFKDRLSTIYHENTKKHIIESYGSLDNFYSSIHIKGDITKKKNGTLNKSKPEDAMYISLCEQYGKENVLRHYKDKEYPYYCDFYIKPLKQYIELNLHWTHGSQPYVENNDFCKKQLADWKEKAKTSKFYENAIQTWTVRDVEKFRIAKENNLNYEAIY